MVFEQMREMPLQDGAEGYGTVYDLEVVNLWSHIHVRMTEFVVQGKRDLTEVKDAHT